MRNDERRSRLSRYVIATRPWSFPMSLISVALGTLIAARSVRVEWGWFAVVALAVVLCHAAGNVLNDYFDTQSGVDQPDSATVKYRPHPVLGGLLTPRGVLVEAALLFAAATALGVLLTAFRTTLVLWIALAGLALTFFYTGGPLRLKYRALGEVVVFLVWGPLLFQGAYAVQTGRFSGSALVGSIPFGVLVALVLFANNIRDLDQDARTRIRTLATLLGRSASLRAFAGLLACAYLYVLGAVLVGALSPWVLLVFLSVPVALGLLRQFRASIPEMADALTAKLDTAFGLLFVAGLLLDSVVAW